MILTERQIVRNKDPIYRDLVTLSKLSNNLYNQGLYRIRQHFFETKEFLNYYSLERQLKSENQVDYRLLPVAVAQQTLIILERDFKSFFKLLKLKNNGNYNKVVRIPRYKEKGGCFIVVFTTNNISKKFIKDGYLKLTSLIHKIPTRVGNPKQVRIIPKGNHFVIETLYEKDYKPLKENNNRYGSIDLGLNNLVTFVSNVDKPFIINGKVVKSINQYYNKKLAYYRSIKATNKIKSLSLKRNNKINDYLHKASRFIVNHLVSNNINTLVLGYNDGWKQDINLGRVNNQRFVSVPFYILKTQLEYKCKLEGINFVTIEESYTSKCSFPDGEEVVKHTEYLGKRVKRGLFISKNGFKINADINGAYNILRKVVSDFNCESKVGNRGLRFNPVRINV